MFSKLAKLHWNSQCNALIFVICRQNTKNFNFNFEASASFTKLLMNHCYWNSQLMQSKILNANIACAGNPSHCKCLRVLRTFSVFAYLCWHSQHNGSKHHLCCFLLTRDYSECSHYWHVTVRTPKLQLSNMFSNVLSLGMMHVERLPSEFQECSEDSL